MKRILKFIFTVAVIIILIFGMYDVRTEVLKKFYIVDYSEYVEEYSEEYNVDKYLIFAIIKAESNFDEDAVSAKGAKGLMQLMMATAEDIAKNLDIDLKDDNILIPNININLGTKYISALMKRYDCVELALAAYNAGSGNVDNWINDGILQDDGSDVENIPYPETNNYVRKILRDYKIYKDLYA